MNSRVLTSYSGNAHILRGAAVLFWTAVFFMVASIVVQFYPEMPSEKLDPSWVFGINQAVAQGLEIGRELVFTFGPYASVYTQTFHPATDFLMIVGAACVALGLGVGIWILSPVRRWAFLLVLLLFLAGGVSPRDTVFFGYIFIAGISVPALLDRAGAGNMPARIPFDVLLALVFFPFGLLPLIKGSLLILGLPASLLAAGLLHLRARPLSALVVLAVPAASLLFFWSLSGQQLSGLPGYFISMATSVAGYTEAMALPGIESEVFSYLAGSLVMLLAIVLETGQPRSVRIYLFLLAAGYVFVVFKAAFVRHDHHALIAGTSLFVAVLTLNLFSSSWRMLVVLAAAAAVFWHIDSDYLGTTATKFGDAILAGVSSDVEGIRIRVTDGQRLVREYHARLAHLSNRSGIPRMDGTTDIYSYNQSFLIASGNTWNPRPVFQSYSAYTPALAEINRQHLLGENAPDNIVFRVEPIDYRIPASEDGPSWAALLDRYMPVSVTGGFLLLKRLDGLSEAKPVQSVSGGRRRFGEWVDLPQTDALVFAKFDIQPTTMGRIAGMAYKPGQIKMDVVLENGTKRTYRVISGLVRSDFLVSPFIENTFEFSMLYGERGRLARKRVRRFAISPVDSAWMWAGEYDVRFSIGGIAPH